MAKIQIFISITWIFIGLNEFLEPSSYPLYLFTFLILNILGFLLINWHILQGLWAYSANGFGQPKNTDYSLYILSLVSSGQ